MFRGWLLWIFLLYLMKWLIGVKKRFLPDLIYDIAGYIQFVFL